MPPMLMESDLGYITLLHDGSRGGFKTLEGGVHKSRGCLCRNVFDNGQEALSLYFATLAIYCAR